MTATQLFERLASTMMVGVRGDASPTGVEIVDTHVKPAIHEAFPDPETQVSPSLLLELPDALLEHVCGFLDHISLHAVESTTSALFQLTNHSDLWMELARHTIIVGGMHYQNHKWKQMLCLSSGLCREDNKLIKGVKAYSSADRPSETPENTLKPSRCWRDITRYRRREALNNHQELYDVPTFVMTLGERIQMRCGCSSGNSCYWSSSASTNKNAEDYIDYELDGPCVISSVQILPYRVFWHPGSPTYGPQSVKVEFYERYPEESNNASENKLVADASEVVPFYTSPVFSVKNDMELQEIRLPVRVWTSASTIMRLRLVGRHQAQTFELPLWMQHTDEDRLPKFYCCLSFVNALGISHSTLLSPQEVSPSRKRLKVAMQTVGMHNSLAEMMAACFDAMMEQRRRMQLLGSSP